MVEMDAPWLSVVLPSHNGQRWLPDTLCSLVRQNNPEIEVVLVDSSDDNASLGIVERFSDALVLRYHRRPDLKPWTAKTNFAVQQATGSYICMLHQDDLWQPERAAHIRDWITRWPDAVMHIHPAFIIDETGKRLGLWRCPLPSNSPIPADTLLARLLVQNFIAIPTPVIRRHAFLAAGGLDDRLWYTADWDLYLKLAIAGPVYYHSDALACFRIHKSSLTVSGSRSIDDFRSQMEIVVARFADRLAPRSAQAVLPVARAAIAVNTALAAANSSQPAGLTRALLRVIALGPSGVFRFVRDSRIVERTWPRLRARFAGAF